MTFKAYVTAVMNKLTRVSFHKVGWQQPPVVLQIYFSICMPNTIKL